MANISKETEIAQIQALNTGVPEYCASMTFTLAGITYTAPQVVQVTGALLAADQATVQAKVAYETAKAAETKLFSTDGPIVRELRKNLAVAFSNSPATLVELDIAPRKAPKPLSPAALAARAAKAKATRLARGTTSKKQKATVHGNVSGVTITPIVTGTAATLPTTATTSAAPAAAPAAAPVVGPVTNGTAAGTPSHG